MKLVCVFGPNQDNEYILENGSYHVGTSNAMDIIIEKDLKVTRDNHCILVCEDGCVNLIPCQGSLTYLNNMRLMDCITLKLGDVLHIGMCDYELVE